MLGRGSEYRSLDKILPMPVWVYSDLERWHYLSLLKSNDTLQMLRSIRYHSLEPEKLGALLHVIQNDLGFYLHRSIQTTKSELSSLDESLFLFNDAVVHIEASLTRARFEEWIEEKESNHKKHKRHKNGSYSCAFCASCGYSSLLNSS